MATVVEHALPQLAQWLALLVVSTQVPLQRVGVPAGQPDTHVEPEHTGVPPLQAVPQAPQ